MHLVLSEEEANHRRIHQYVLHSRRLGKLCKDSVNMKKMCLEPLNISHQAKPTRRDLSFITQVASSTELAA